MFGGVRMGLMGTPMAPEYGFKPPSALDGYLTGGAGQDAFGPLKQMNELQNNAIRSPGYGGRGPAGYQGMNMDPTAYQD